MIAYLRLMVYLVLSGTYMHMLVVMAVCCSSWVALSKGSTGRSEITPMGCTVYIKVQEANKMVSRRGLQHKLIQ